MTVATSDLPNSTADREIVITRLINAPREAVFAAWKDAEHIGEWWGPNGFTTTVHSMDVRTGGAWSYTMHGPDGTDYENYMEYLDVVENECISGWLGEFSKDPNAFHFTATFADEGGKTRLTMHTIFASPDVLQAVMKFGAVEGGKQNLARCDAYMATIHDVTDSDIVIARVIDAPNSLVFRAFTDASELNQWFGPHGFTNECSVDLRVGGKLRIVMIAPDGGRYPIDGVYREIAEPERVVYSCTLFDHPPEWQQMVRDAMVANGGGTPTLHSVVTLTFSEQQGQTLLSIKTTFDTATERNAFASMGMNGGWNQSLGKLEALLARH